jgi:adenosine deaminase
LNVYKPNKIIAEEVKKMYKGSLLHVHFSGMVRTEILLDRIFIKYRNLIFWNRKRKKLSLIVQTQQTPYDDVKYEIKKTIQEAWKKEPFYTIGTMFFEVIKHRQFYLEYIQLIEEEMIRQNIDHVELRLKIGSLFEWRGTKKCFFSLQHELELLFQAQKDLLTRNKSFVIIAQYSKHRTPIEVYNYFYEIIQLMDRYPDLRKVVKGFDIVGNETAGNHLQAYQRIIIRLQAMMNEMEIFIPFLFHAGEILNHKGMQNVRFALEHGQYRIGHGITALQKPELVQELKNRRFVLEFCPISMLLLKNLQKDTLKKILTSPLPFTINSDDPNKFNDFDLNDNFIWLLEHGFTWQDIYNAIHYSIEAALCDENFKIYMRNKFIF